MMAYLVTSLVVFLFFFFLHVFVHRILEVFGKQTFMSVGIFIAGIAVEAYVAYTIIPTTGSLVMSSIVLYISMAWAYVIFFSAIYLGEVSPSAKIIALVKKKKSVTIGEIIASFSDEEIIVNRLNDTLRAGWIDKRKGRYTLAANGKRLVVFITVWRKILGITRGG